MAKEIPLLIVTIGIQHVLEYCRKPGATCRLAKPRRIYSKLYIKKQRCDLYIGTRQHLRQKIIYIPTCVGPYDAPDTAALSLCLNPSAGLPLPERLCPISGGLAGLSFRSVDVDVLDLAAVSKRSLSVAKSSGLRGVTISRTTAMRVHRRYRVYWTTELHDQLRCSE